MAGVTARQADPRLDGPRATILRWRADPVLFVREALSAEPQEWQAEALWAIRDHDRVAIRSGHGVGKSTILAWAILWWIATRYPVKVATTAPTEHQLSDVLWSELATWLRRMPEALRAQFVLTRERLALVKAEAESFAAARVARKEQPEALAGFHSPNMLLIADEASGIPDIIYETGAGTMSTAGAKTVLAGNPTRASGYFFGAFTRARDLWHCLHVPCSRSPMVSQDYASGIAAEYGEGSNVYRVRVLGEFPTSDDDALIPLELVEAAMAREVAATGRAVVWGVDVARFGDDRSTLAKRRGNVLLEPVRAWRGKDLMQTCGLLMAEWEATRPVDRPVDIAVDVIGMGAGVVDRLRELRLPARGINVAESAAVSDRFLRLRDELWWLVRDWLAARDCSLPPDDALASELTAPRYSLTSAGKVVVEPKSELKKRGLASPDLADALCLTFAASDRRAARNLGPGPVDRYARRRAEQAGRGSGSGSWMGA